MSRRRCYSVAALLVTTLAVAAFAMGCRLVGSGTLDRINCDPRSGDCLPASTGSLVTVHVFRAAPGDAWPPPGRLGVSLRVEQIPSRDGQESLPTLVLLRLIDRNCRQLGLNSLFVLGENRVGAVNIASDRTLNALLVVDDTPENLQTSWVLATEAVSPSPYGTPIRGGAISLDPP